MPDKTLDPQALEHVRALLKHDPEVLERTLHTERRRAEHAAAKESQPELTAELRAGDWATLKAEMHRDLDPEDAKQTGLTYLCQTVHECVEADNVHDAIFALIRVYRKCWALQPHLGPINPKGQQTK